MLKLSLLPGSRSKLSFPKVRWGGISDRPTYILEFHPEGENFTLVATESEGVERDLAAEIEALLTDGVPRTVQEIAASKEPRSEGKKPGVGANERAVKATLEGKPETFTQRPGNEVGRRKDAVCWQLKSYVGAPDVVDVAPPPGGWNRKATSLRQPYIEGDVADVASPPDVTTSTSPTYLPPEEPLADPPEEERL
jgi:hypothetical protein